VNPRAIVFLTVITATTAASLAPATAQMPQWPAFLRSLTRPPPPPPLVLPQAPPLPMPRPEVAAPTPQPEIAAPTPQPQVATPLPVSRMAPGPPARADNPEVAEEVAVAPLEVPVVPVGPSACRMRLTSDIAIAPSLDPIDGEGECDVADPVRLEAVLLKDGSKVTLSPPASLRCSMAEAVALWVREDAAPALAQRGTLKSIEVYDALSCRPRNRIPGAKISEHGKGNAIDIRTLALTDGTAITPTDFDVARPLRAQLRERACARFATVLGPGSDGYHEAHVHFDLAERRNGYRLCQWELDPPPEVIPLPPTRPVAAVIDAAPPENGAAK
jgi:hypothetical protein